MISEYINQISTSSVRLNEFVNKYYELIKFYIDRQILEEDTRNRSNSQYNYVIASYAQRYANIISYLVKFKSYDEVYKDLQVDRLSKMLAKRGINFNDILKIYNLPKVKYDDKEVSYFQIGVSPISDVEVGIHITTANSHLEDIVLPTLDPFTIHTAITDEDDITTIDDLYGIMPFVSYGADSSVTLEFIDFDDLHPVIIVPIDVDVKVIREQSTYHEITDGFVKSDVQVEVGNILHNVYIYYMPTLSDDNNKWILQLDYIRL